MHFSGHLIHRGVREDPAIVRDVIRMVSVELVEDSFAEALAPKIEDLVNDIKGLYLTGTRQGRHMPEPVEEAGLLLLTALYHEVDRLEREYKRGPQLSVSASVDSTPYETVASNMRSSKSGETNVVRMHY